MREFWFSFVRAGELTFTSDTVGEGLDPPVDEIKPFVAGAASYSPTDLHSNVRPFVLSNVLAVSEIDEISVYRNETAALSFAYLVEKLLRDLKFKLLATVSQKGCAKMQTVF